MKSRILFVVICFFIVNNAFGDTFMDNNIEYKITSPTTVSVNRGGYYYADTLTIHESVTYQQKVYRIDSIETRAFSNSSLKSITLPSTIKGIGEFAFSGCMELTSINIPNSVKTIRNYVFSSCSNLLSIAIPDSVTTIGNFAFSYCRRLSYATIPASVTTIGNYAFSDCTELIAVDIPNSIKTIGDHAFSGCFELTSITIPSSVKAIGDGAFIYCTSLTGIIVDSNNNYYSAVDGVLYNKDQSILLMWPITKLNLIIPNSVTTIGNYAFCYFKALTSITIPTTVTIIGNYAFSDCSKLTTVTIPNSVKIIGDGAFYCCTGLSSINIPSSVINIGGMAFYNCSSLKSITIPSSVTSIGWGGFYFCKNLTSIHANPMIPVNLKDSNYVFEGIDKINCILYVPKGTKILYSVSLQWMDFQNIIEEDVNEVKEINANELMIKIVNNQLILPEGLQLSKIQVIDLNGKMIYYGSVNKNNKILLPEKGIYIVLIDDKCAKIINL